MPLHLKGPRDRIFLRSNATIQQQVSHMHKQIHHPIRQILWDWNGTLLDDLQYAISVRNRTFPAFGLPTIDSLEEYYRQFTFPVRLY